MSELKQLLSGRVIYLRQRAGMTQEELAQAAGVGLDAIGRLERGQVTPSVDTLQAIAQVLVAVDVVDRRGDDDEVFQPLGMMPLGDFSHEHLNGFLALHLTPMDVGLQVNDNTPGRARSLCA